MHLAVSAGHETSISQIQYMNWEEKEGGSVLHGHDLLRVALVCVQTDP